MSDPLSDCSFEPMIPFVCESIKETQMAHSNEEKNTKQESDSVQLEVSMVEKRQNKMEAELESDEFAASVLNDKSNANATAEDYDAYEEEYESDVENIINDMLDDAWYSLDASLETYPTRGIEIDVLKGAISELELHINNNGGLRTPDMVKTLGTAMDDVMGISSSKAGVDDAIPLITDSDLESLWKASLLDDEGRDEKAYYERYSSSSSSSAEADNAVLITADALSELFTFYAVSTLEFKAGLQPTEYQVGCLYGPGCTGYHTIDRSLVDSGVALSKTTKALLGVGGALGGLLLLAGLFWGWRRGKGKGKGKARAAPGQVGEEVIDDVEMIRVVEGKVVAVKQ